jgi:hypothetical protein
MSPLRFNIQNIAISATNIPNALSVIEKAVAENKPDLSPLNGQSWSQKIQTKIHVK